MKTTRDFKSENEYLVTHVVDRTGIRLDAFLKERYRRRSRQTLKRAIHSGAITVQREQSPHLTVGKLKASTQLIAGDEVLVLSERRPEPPVCFDYKVLYEDEVLFIIEKPANLPVHPAGRYFFNTLLVHLRTEGHRQPLRSEREYFLVHRIDKETSGVLVLATDRDVCAHLVRQFAERTTEKRYLAIVRGVAPEEFVIDAPMMRHTRSAISLKMMIAPESEGGQTALTRFKRLSVHGDYSLLECFPKTGRQHQIRLHLDHAGHPIVGDKLYGIDESETLRFYERENISAEAEAALKAKLKLPRHALHASSIRFEHPLTGLRMEFSSPLPQELEAFLQEQTILSQPQKSPSPALASDRPGQLTTEPAPLL